MIKVLMFGWEFPPNNSGGLGTACLGLTKAMTAQDVKITFVLPRKTDVSENENFSVRFADESMQNIDFKFVNAIIEPYLTSEQYLKLLKKNKLGLKHGRNLYE